MSPTEKLALSRIRECYGIKVEQAKWKEIIESIKNSESKAMPFVLKTRQIEIADNSGEKVNEQSLVYEKGNEWFPEDQVEVDQESQEWKSFITFLDQFYDSDKPQKWSSSLDNALSRQKNKRSNQKKVSDEVNAIPGGRYGCAQYIRICGPTNLKNLQIGRLIGFV